MKKSSRDRSYFMNWLRTGEKQKRRELKGYDTPLTFFALVLVIIFCVALYVGTTYGVNSIHSLQFLLNREWR